MGRPRVRDKILRAAGELFDEHGITGLTTRGVARQAGVTEASVFNNFGDKAGLIQSLVREQVSEFQQFSRALAASPEPDLQAWLGQVFIAACGFFRVVLPLAGPQLSRGRKAEAKQPRENYAGHAALARRLESFQQQGLVDASVDTGAAALLLMGAAMHSALTAVTLGDGALGEGDQGLVGGVTGSLVKLLRPQRDAG
jgi:AcrR family transcriptional regulator